MASKGLEVDALDLLAKYHHNTVLITKGIVTYRYSHFDITLLLQKVYYTFCIIILNI